MRMEKVLLHIIRASAVCVVSSLTVRQYHFIYDPKNWTDAQSYCRETYTDLVTVNSSSVVSVLNSKVDVTKMNSAKDAWIGLHFEGLSWNWSLSDQAFYSGNGANYRNWAGGEPNSVGYSEECSQMYDNGLWNDAPCVWVYESICANVSGPNVTFVVVSQLLSWPDAQSYCRQHFTDLASVRSASENEKIRTLKPAGLTVWIGLYKNAWIWSNGPMYIFSNWASLPPDDGRVKCAAADFGVSGGWTYWTCDVKKPFICHHDVVPFTRQVVKVKLVTSLALDLNDPAVLENLLQELKQQLKDQGVTEDIKLSWKTQPDGKIFFKDKNQN